MKTLRFTFLFCLAIAAFGCKSSTKKIQESTDTAFKIKKANEFYDNEKFEKALPLYEELVISTKGTPFFEDIYYRYCYTELNLGNYELAEYHFKNFYQGLSTSPRVQEMQYMYAYTLYLQSPEPSLDQSSTKKAIEALQIFINKYPESDKVESANEIIKKLRLKLEQKSYKLAMMYYHMEDYRAAATALQNTINDFPDTDQREYIEFLITKSFYKLASNSIESKKIERYEKTIVAYNNLKEDFPASTYLKEANKYFETSNEELKKLNEKN